ncbi:MAG: ash family protein [Endozoicomonas sp.]|uniref:ash family protein n=1 Tax=Endozoicomonas sp. TaxID=1892382 RepID=UPI003D9AC546
MKNKKTQLKDSRLESYTENALAKSSVGIGTPVYSKEHKSLYLIAAFFVHSTCICLFMVGRVGQPFGWPVSFEAGSTNPSRSASIMRLVPLGGGLETDSKEAMMANNILSLTGIPVDTCPPDYIRDADDIDVINQLSQQVISFQSEVGNLHQFSQLMDEHGDDVLQGVAQQIAVYMRHFDTRLNEIESLVTEVRGRLNG